MNRKSDTIERRIAILSPSHGIWGGGQIYIEKLCRHISRDGSCLVYTSEPERFSCATRAIPRINTPGRRAAHLFGIVAAMRAEGITHVVLNDLAAAWLAPLFRLAGFTTVPLLHIPLMVAREGRSGHSRFAYHFIRSCVRLGGHKILNVSLDNRFIAPEKTVFVGNFVPARFFGAPCREKSYDLCFVGRFSWEKNVQLLLRIVALCRSRYRRDLKVLLVGEGPDEASIRATVAELGIADLVTISGWVARERLPELYASARCFVIASHHEGFATTLLESHACGIPACTTEAGYCGTFVREHGARTGFVFAERDLDRPDFYRNLFDLVDNHASYRESCIAKAALFGEEAVLGKIYQEICL